MPIPVEVLLVGRRAFGGIGGLGGTWRDRPWYMSERRPIGEIERPTNERQWDFFVASARRHLSVTVELRNSRKVLDAGRRCGSVGLPDADDCLIKQVGESEW
jgi:hypothetical protein